jgi:hypothetical protein
VDLFDEPNGGMGIKKCRLCNQKFKLQMDLQKHLMKKHKDDDWSHAGQAKHIDIKKKMNLENSKMKTSNYKVIAEAIVNGEIGKAEMPLENLETVKLEAKKVLEIVKEEFGKVVDLNTKKLPKEMHFKDAELAKEINWADELDLKEFFIK